VFLLAGGQGPPIPGEVGGRAVIGGFGEDARGWRSSGRSGFGIHGEELANRADERKPLKLCP